MKMFFRFVPLILLCFYGRLSSQIPGPADSILSLERIFLKPYIAGSRPSDPKLSADGKRMLFRWDETARGRAKLWIMNSDGSGTMTPADSTLGEIEWSPDGKTIVCSRFGDLFVADSSLTSFRRLLKTEASENGIRWSPTNDAIAFSSADRLWVMNVAHGALYEIAKSSSKDSWISFLDFSPDGRFVAFAEYDREGLQEFIVPRFTPKDVTTNTFKGGMSKTRVGIAPVDTGKIRWLAFPGDERFFLGECAFNPDGSSFLVERLSQNRKSREIFLADLDSVKPRLVYSEKDTAWIEGGLSGVRWLLDGSSILLTSEKDGWNQFYNVSKDGSESRLTKGEWEIHWFEQSGNEIFFQANKDDHHQWQLFSFDLKTKLIRKVSSREGSYENPVLAKDGSFIVARYSDFAMPAELVRIPTVQSALTAIDSRAAGLSAEAQLTSSVPEEFRDRKWVVPEIVHFTAKDGERVPAMIYKPLDFNPSEKYPVVVFVHGAGYLQNVYRGWSYYYREYLFHHRLTQLGYVVFEVDYRGSAGYGRKFRTDVYMHLGGKDLQDELDGLDYLTSLGYVDSSRVGVYGGSYGGFMALMGLFLTDKYSCGAALRAVTSWENYYRHNMWYTEARLGKPEEHAEAYKISSPITFADSLNEPLLILHGMMDDNVFFQDAVQLIGKLQKARKSFEVMVYPDEAHSFTEPESWYDEFGRIEEFFSRHVMNSK